MFAKKHSRDVIATRAYEVRWPDGGAGQATIKFLKPHRVAEGDWKCGLVIEGLSMSPHPLWAHGVDAVQAFLLAVWLAEAQLRSSIEFKARRLTFLGGRELGLLRGMKSMLGKQEQAGTRKRATVRR